MDCSFNNTMIKVVNIFSSFFGSIWLTWPLTIHNTVHWSVRHTQSFRCLLIYLIKWDKWLLRCLFLTKKDVLQTSGIPEISQTFYPCYKKVHVAERKILQVRYPTYGWLFYKVHLLPPEKWQQNRTKIQNFIWVQPQPK